MRGPAPLGRAPAVSVVIPTYGHRDYVLEAIESVRRQTFCDYELLVVNDGSPDDTAELVGREAQAGRLRYIEQAHAGPSAARNLGLSESRGEFIAFLDDDDLWPNDKLEWQVAALRAEPSAVLAYGAVETFGIEGVSCFPGADGPSGWVRERFLAKNWIRSPGQTLIRTAALRDAGGFDSTVWGADDWDVYLRLAARGPFVYRERRALHYRTHARNASYDVVRMFVNACRVHARHAGRLPSPAGTLRWIRCRLSIINYCCRQFWRARRSRRDASLRPPAASLE
jgi:glycosyltransferase involved in cell wall biosynthesis